MSVLSFAELKLWFIKFFGRKEENSFIGSSITAQPQLNNMRWTNMIMLTSRLWETDIRLYFASSFLGISIRRLAEI